MAVKEIEIERIARDMIERHGRRAPQVAIERLNDMIDRNNTRGRDIWACVVHLIHERQGSGPAWPEASPDRHTPAPRFAAAF